MAGLGLYAHLKGMYKKAAEIFDLAIEMHPADLTPFQAGAAAWVAAGDPSRAIHNLEAAIEADPADETSYTMLAEIYGGQGNAREQIRVVDRYLAFRPQSIEFRLRRRAMETGPASR